MRTCLRNLIIIAACTTPAIVSADDVERERPA